jgi:hypothetical protein
MILLSYRLQMKYIRPFDVEILRINEHGTSAFQAIINRTQKKDSETLKIGKNHYHHFSFSNLKNTPRKIFKRHGAENKVKRNHDFIHDIS